MFRPFLRHVCVTDFCSCALVFVMLSTTRSDARARKGVSFYLFACRFPVFLYTNCTSVYLVWQIHFFSDLEMYYACGFVIKAMIICSSQMGVLDFGPALAYWVSIVRERTRLHSPVRDARCQKRNCSAWNGQAATNPTPNPSQYVVVSFHLIRRAIQPMQPTPSGSLFFKIQAKTTPKGRVYFHHYIRPLKTRLVTRSPL